jgi:CYTH domain-containing protein
MKKKALFLLSAGMLITSVGCQKQEADHTSALNATDSVAVASKGMTSEVAKPLASSEKKFVRSGEARVKVNNVVQSTHRIEQAVSRAGGFITQSDLTSVVDRQEETQVSADSVWVTTQYHTQSTLTLRIPEQELPSVLQHIAQEIVYLDYRKLGAEDVTLHLLNHTLEQQRHQKSAERLAQKIDTNKGRLDPVIAAEKERSDKQAQADGKYIEKLALSDKVRYATLTLALYQESAVLNERKALLSVPERLRPSLGFQLWENAKIGWSALEQLLSFLILFWPLGVLGTLGYMGYRRWGRK